MRRFVKFLCSIASACLALGIILTIIGFAMGGRPNNISFDWKHGPRLVYSEVGNGGANRTEPIETGKNYSAEKSAEIHSLQVDVGGASVVIKNGEQFDLFVTGTNNFTAEIDNGVWEIESDWSGVASNVTFTVTVPSDFDFDEITLHMGAGTLEAEDLRCKNADIEIGAGKMTLNDFAASGKTDIEIGMGALNFNGSLLGKVNIDCGMGSAKFNLERPATYGYDVDCGIGSVNLDGKSFSGLGVTGHQDIGSANFYGIDCGMGSVNINFE